MLLCEECSINSCGQNFQKDSWKEKFWKITVSKSGALSKMESVAVNCSKIS